MKKKCEFVITFLTVGDGAGPRSVHAFGHVGSDQLETVFALVQSLRSVLDPRRYHHAVPRSFRQRFAARYQRSQFIFICTCHTFINYFFHSFILSFFLSFFLSIYHGLFFGRVLQPEGLAGLRGRQRQFRELAGLKPVWAGFIQ